MKKFREFGISSWAIENRTTIYLVLLAILLAGTTAYNSLPKENFPEIDFPMIYVSTPYPGTSPSDIEKLVNKKIEKELKGIKGVKEINSTAMQDFGNVFVEFEPEVDIPEAKREVQEAVDRAKSDLPTDLPNDPQVQDINLSEIPIMYINLSGPYDKVALKNFAEDLQDDLENDVEEILRADIIGALEQEVQVDVDLYKMQQAWVTFGDIEGAIANENVIISGGEVDIDRQKVAVRLNSELKSAEAIANLKVRSGKGHSLYLRDIATITDGFKEQESYARLDREPVITLSVIKKGSKNLVDAAAKINVLLDELQEDKFPENLNVSIAQDQSIMTLTTLNELTNTIIIGFILVILVLMFFMGVRDAFFVGLAVPISSMIAFAIIPIFGFTLNLIVLFTFILAMGIVVDNAIVVIENTHRIFKEEKLPIKLAAKKAAGEVIGPVFSGTLTTIAPFTPLLFWPGTVGDFMSFLPVTMIITLFASLFVAYVISPVFAVSFMKEGKEKVNYKNLLIYTGVFALLALMFHGMGLPLLGNLMIFMIIFVWLNAVVLRPFIDFFQNRILVGFKNAYRNTLRWSVNHPGIVLGSTLVMVFMIMGVIGANPPKVIFFPESDPNFVYVYNEMPVGTKAEVTDSVTKIVEKRVYDVIEPHRDIVKSVISNVAVNAGDPNSFNEGNATPHKSRVTVEFVSVKDRNGKNTTEIMEEVRTAVKGIVGTKITVDKENNGPPTGAPIEVQLTSEDQDKLMEFGAGLLAFMESKSIPGVEKLKSDAESDKSELVVNIDKVKASELGLSSGQIGMALRTAIYGKEVSKFRPPKSEDEYDIVLRLDERYRNDLNSLLNMNVTFMDQATGGFRSIPISTVADFEYSSTISGINRTDLEKSVTLSTNVIEPFNPAEVSKDVMYWVGQFKKNSPLGSAITVKLAGQVVEQEKEGAYLSKAFGFSILLIFLILVTQFNSLINVMIILTQVILSSLGAMLGVSLMGMDFSVIMNGVGIIALAGIVVNNGIILLDFIKQLEKEGYDLKDAVVEGGAIRFTPVLLTASSTVLGLVPLALSMNINFESLFLTLDPQIFFGGDSAAFWGPLSWTIIWGLTFATLITLVFVPVLYSAVHIGNKKLLRFFGVRSEQKISVDEEEKIFLRNLNSNGHDSNGHSSNGHTASDIKVNVIEGPDVEEKPEPSPN
jgi:multidrug efflux pump subunit AcrB